MVLVDLCIAAGGIALLCFGADRLVDGASRVARSLGISNFVVGMTVVAMGTSAPELAAAVAAALSGHTDIILGNVTGSNTANIGMVVGVAALLGGAVIARHAIRREIPLMLAFCGLLALVSLGGSIGAPDGLLLLACLVAFVVWTLRGSPPGVTGGTPAGNRRAIPYGMVLLGIACLWGGSLLTIQGVTGAAEQLGVSGRVMGITVIAVGTSLPELITVIQAVRRRTPDIGIANIIGSCMVNILLIVGVSALVTRIAVPQAAHLDYAVMLAFGGCLYLGWRGSIPRAAGAALVGGYAVYLMVGVL